MITHQFFSPFCPLQSSIVEPISGVIRNRVLSLASRVFSEFEQWNYRPQNSNPTFGIKRVREEARDRVPAASEMAALAKSLKQHEERHPVSVAAIRVTALTGLRIGEVWESSGATSTLRQAV